MQKTIGILFILTILFAPVVGNAQQNKQGINKPEIVMEKTGTKETVQNAGQVEQIQSQIPNQTQQLNTINLEQNTNTEQKGLDKTKNAGTKNVKKGSQNQRMVSRRSVVANAVQEMKKIATRNQGVGD